MKFTAKAEIEIKAPKAKVWAALTDPKMIKEWLFGTKVTTDWEVGSPITYKGEWQGKTYEDKGKILEVVPGKRLVSTYWSSMSGVPDKPGNYMTVTYELSEKGGVTKLKLVQDNNPTKEGADHSEQNWKAVFGKLKSLVEGKP